MIEGELINMVSTVGFPIAVTFYLLFRFEGKLAANTDVMTDLLIYLKTKR